MTLTDAADVVRCSMIMFRWLALSVLTISACSAGTGSDDAGQPNSDLGTVGAMPAVALVLKCPLDQLFVDSINFYSSCYPAPGANNVLFKFPQSSASSQVFNNPTDPGRFVVIDQLLDHNIQYVSADDWLYFGYEYVLPPTATAPIALHPPAGCGGDGLTRADETNIYCVQYDPSSQNLAINATARTMDKWHMVYQQAQANPIQAVVDNGTLYWVTDLRDAQATRILAVLPPGATAPMQFPLPDSTYALKMARDGEALIRNQVASNQYALQRFTVATGKLTKLLDIPVKSLPVTGNVVTAETISFASDEQFFYWYLAYDSSGNWLPTEGSIQKVPLHDGDVSTVISNRPTFGGRGSQLAVDAQNLYWLERGATSGDTTLPGGSWAIMTMHK